MVERWTVTFLVAVALTAVVAEVVLRTTYYNELREQQYPLAYQADEQIGYRYVPGSTGAVCNADICRSFAIGANGFTTPSHPTQRASGVYRIAMVGSSNETGRLELRLGVADIVPVGVALSHKSRWPKLSKQHANINALNPGRKTDMAESSAVHSVEITLTRRR